MRQARTPLPHFVRLFAFAALLAPAVAQAPFDPQDGPACRAGDGWICVAEGKDLWRVDAQGKATALGEVKIPAPPGAAGAEPGQPAAPFLEPYVTSLVGTSKGFAVAVANGCAWHGAGAPTFCTDLRDAQLAVADDRVVAAGTATVDGVDTLAVATVCDDGAWTVRRLAVTNAKLLGVAKVGLRWYVYAGRNDAAPERADLDATEMWTSVDGATWSRCRLPQDVRTSPLQWNAAFAVFGGSVVAVSGERVLCCTAPDAFEARTRANPLCKTPDGALFVVGDTLYEVAPYYLHATTDLRLWTSRRTVHEPFGPAPTVRIAGLRDGKLVALQRDAASGAIVERTPDTLYAPIVLGGPVPTPAALRRIELPGVDVLGMPQWTGACMFLATNRGLHESVDGAQWPLRHNGWPGGFGAKDCETLAFGDLTLAWRRGELRDPAARRIRLCVGPDNPLDLNNDFAPRFGATDGRAMAFLSPPTKDTYDGTGWTLHVSRDSGSTWTASPSPVLRPQGIDHGPLGWCVFGDNPQGGIDDLVALSSDLATWRLSPGVERHPMFDAMLRVGERIVAVGRPATADKGVEDGMSVAVTTDGAQWTTRTLPGFHHAKAVVVGRQIWLLATDATLASLDGADWRRMPAELLPKGTDAIVQQDGTWFVRTVTYTETPQQTMLRTQSLWRRPAVADAEIEAAPAHPAQLYQWLSPGIAYLQAVAAADAAMTLAKTHRERIDAVGRVGEAWRAAIPAVAASETVAEAAAWYQRLLDYQTDDDAVYDAALAVTSFLDPKSGEVRDFFAKQPENVRSYVKARSDAMRKGTTAPRPGFKRTGTSPKPQQQPAWFDVRVWREAAANGNVGAMIDLMRAYANGAGVPRDDVASLFWAAQARRRGYEVPTEWNEATEQAAMARGSCMAMTFLGVRRNDPQQRSFDPVAARDLLRRAAEAGSTLAMLEAAVTLADGTAADMAAGAAFAQRAADAGNVAAVRWLGVLHEWGAGVPRSLPQAVAHYRRAAELGETVAMSLLGELEYFGIGTPIDRQSGMRWLEQAAQRGSPDGKRLVESLRDSKSPSTRRPMQRDRRERKPAQFDLAARRAQADAGDAAACHDMAQAHGLGLGVDQNARWAQYWRARVAEAGGDPDASIKAWSERGSLHAALRDAELVGFEFDRDDKRLAALQKIASVNLQAAHEAAMLTLKRAGDDARADDKRRAAIAALVANAAAGHYGSLVAVGRRQLDGDGVPKDVAAAVASFRRAADLGSREGAWLAAHVGVAQDADPGESLRLYLQAAGMESAAPPPAGATEQAVWSHRDGEYQRLLAAARSGDVAALDAAAVLLCQPPQGVGLLDLITAAAFAWVADDMFAAEPALGGARSFVRRATARLDAQEQARVLQIARDTAQRIARQQARELGRDEHAERVAASAPDRGMLKLVLQGLLDGAGEGAMAGWDHRIAEALPNLDFERLVIEAEKHPGKRGEELLHAMAGVAIGDRAAYERAIAKKPKRDGSMVALLEETQQESGVKRQLREAEAIRRWYGLGCQADPVEALAWLLHAEVGPKWHGLLWIAEGFTTQQWQQAVARRLELQADR